ncbi:MAG: DUF362 domain-containing protein [Phycisphaerae bacterium]|nr:DUF362 domain-containing protein [Phycisphaerae bacterium]NIP53133.1 DUF362 domain-containing protein [Phycisphaerae bacterium]NIS53513.1 DUF362 domain-containing protein [Phycisphaerae bacterium]NIU09706.1 DUF362 domain-containing protein [Phycisphaerae bacterium]NIU58862.1 DUF362 domain-containing protein [Phycisphaerae bacterium]
MVSDRNRLNRRDILKGFGIGALGLAFSGRTFGPGIADAAPGSPHVKKDRLFSTETKRAKVSVVKGNERRQITYQALKNIEDEILGSIEGKKKILIKPNFVITSRQLAATHVEAVRAILDFLKPHYKGEIIIGESTISKEGTFDGYKNYGYLPLEKEYKVKLVDLNLQSWQYRYVFGKGHRPTPIRIISTFLDPDVYIISAAKMKTHDRVLTTLSLKNVLLGAPLYDYKKNDKRLTHAAYNFSREAVLHYNMFHLAQEIYPDLGVIDGFEAMEGNGPTGGTPVDARITLASRDPLAMDILATKIMGFDPGKIMYLTAMAEAGMGQGDLDKIKVLGTPIEQCQYHFKAHKRMIEPYIG